MQYDIRFDIKKSTVILKTTLQNTSLTKAQKELKDRKFRLTNNVACLI